MAKVILSQSDREADEMFKRMDLFDAVVKEYLRSQRKTVEELCTNLEIDVSTLWRYRRQQLYFKKAPFDVICRCLKLARVDNETLRFICGL